MTKTALILIVLLSATINGQISKTASFPISAPVVNQSPAFRPAPVPVLNPVPVSPGPVVSPVPVLNPGPVVSPVPVADPAINLAAQQALAAETAFINQASLFQNTLPDINLSSRLKVVNLKSIQRPGETLYKTLQRVYKSPKTDAVRKAIQDKRNGNGPITANTQIAAKSLSFGARLLAGAGVQSFVNSMYIDPPTPIVEGANVIATEILPSGNDVCTYNAISAVGSTNEIANAHNPIDSNTYPSATVQSKFFTSTLAGNSAQSLVTVPFAFNTPSIDLVDYNSGEYQAPVNSKIAIIKALKIMYDTVMNGTCIEIGAPPTISMPTSKIGISTLISSLNLVPTSSPTAVLPYTKRKSSSSCKFKS